MDVTAGRDAFSAGRDQYIDNRKVEPPPHPSEVNMERAVRITEAVLGPDHLSTAIRLGNLAFTYRELGRDGDAIPLEERAAEIRRRNQQ